MLKLSHAIRETVFKNQWFEWGLSCHFLNLSKLAAYLKPVLEVRLKKEVSASSIVMNLSRLQRNMAKTALAPHPFRLDNLTIHSDLAILTYQKTYEIHRQINYFYNAVIKANGYITIAEGIHQITLIINEAFVAKGQKIIQAKPLSAYVNVVAIGVEFSEKYVNTPGFFHAILQKIALQNINILEITSTYTELIFYFDRKDLKVAFDTMVNS